MISRVSTENPKCTFLKDSPDYINKETKVLIQAPIHDIDVKQKRN